LLRAFVEREAHVGGQFAPRHLEWRFGWREGEHAPGGTEGDAPSLTLGESVRVRGVIDRIDCDEAEAQWEIIDYKTGSAKFNSADVMEGRHLQLPLYALAAGETLAGDQSEVVAASIHSVGRIRDLGVTRLYALKGAVPNARGKNPDEIAEILEAARWHGRGVAERTGGGDFHWTTRPEKDACKSCPWIRTCRRDEEKVAELGPPPPFTTDEGNAS
jgi:RecB family exonuclease